MKHPLGSLRTAPSPVAVALMLALQPVLVSGAQVSVDLGQRLEGSVIVYNVFVEPDDGSTYWTSDSMQAVLTEVQRAADELSELALSVDGMVNLDIEVATAPGLARKIADPDLYAGLKVGWVCEALSFLSPLAGADPDGDGICSDDVALWLQRSRAKRHVVIAFHVWKDVSVGEGGTIGHLDREIHGPIVVYYGREGSLDWKDYAHEILHQFGACDEYVGACTCVCDNAFIHYGYGTISENGETNPNCESCPTGLSRRCMMRAHAPHGELCLYTRRQIGWGDSDDDRRADAVDFDDGLDAFVVSSDIQFRTGSVGDGFTVSDVAGGELEVDLDAEVVEPWGPPVSAFPLPLRGKCSLVASNGYFFFRGGYYFDETGTMVFSSTLYSASYDGAAITSSWQTVAAIPRLSGEMVASNGYLYLAAPWDDGVSGLRVSAIQADGTLGQWTPLMIAWSVTPTDGSRLNLAVLNGTLFAQENPNDNETYIRGAPLNSDGTIGPWDEPTIIDDRRGPSDLTGYSNALYIVGGMSSDPNLGPTRTWYVPVSVDGSRGAPVETSAIPGIGGGYVYNSTCVAIAGRLMAIGGMFRVPPSEYTQDANRIMVSEIQANASLGPWTELRDLPFEYGGAFPGATVTDEGSLRLWVGGGKGNYPLDAHNDLYVTGLGIPWAAYRMNFGAPAPKLLNAIYWRSTNPERTFLRYRIPGVTDWSSAFAESDGRVIPPSGHEMAALEFEVFAHDVDKSTRVHDITVVYTDPSPGLTAEGNEVLTTLPNFGGLCRFESVSQSGFTDAVPIVNPPSPPAGSIMRGAFTVTTSASFTGEVEIGLRYNPLTVISEARMKLLHDTNGQWEDITTHVDPIAQLVWGRVSSLSPFALTEDTTTVATAVRDSPSPTPSFTVVQNAPNPFGATTTIRFGLSRPDHVTLRVYDVAGRLVRILFEGSAPAGEGMVEWDGKNQNGAPASSGVYFYRFQAGTHVQTKKAVLIR